MVFLIDTKMITLNVLHDNVPFWRLAGGQVISRFSLYLELSSAVTTYIISTTRGKLQQDGRTQERSFIFRDVKPCSMIALHRGYQVISCIYPQEKIIISRKIHSHHQANLKFHKFYTTHGPPIYSLVLMASDGNRQGRPILLPSAWNTVTVLNTVFYSWIKIDQLM